MLNLNSTRIITSVERPVAQGYTITAEGQGLVWDLSAGGVRPASGVATEKFEGFALAQVIHTETMPVALTLTSVPTVVNDKDVVVADPAGLKLSGAPITGTLVAYDNTGAKVSAVALKAGSTDTLDLTTLGDITKAPFKVMFSKQATVADMRALQGDQPAGNAATFVVGSTGVIKSGDVYTDRYNTADDWANATVIKVGADGMLTTSGTGAVVPNAKVISLPGTVQGTFGAFLGISFAA